MEEAQVYEVPLGPLMYGTRVAPETLEVWINGVLQASGDGYAATQQVIVLLDPLLAGDTLRATACPSLESEA